MSEQLIQNKFSYEEIGNYKYYNIGATTLEQLKKANIIPKKDYADLKRKKPDSLILKTSLPFAIVEWKTNNELNSEKKIKRAIIQELKVASKLGTSILILSSDRNSYFVNVFSGKIIDVEGHNENVPFNFDAEMIKLFDFIGTRVNSKTISIKNENLIYMNPIKLSRQVWQDIWTVNGATPENALYTFVEFFIFKYLSDLNILTKTYSFDSLYSQYSHESEEDVLEFYATTIRPKMKKLFPEAEYDGTTIINGTIFVSKDRKAVKGYSSTFKNILTRFLKFGKLENIDYDFKSQLVESFLKESISKKNWGQFFTPISIVDEIVEMANSELKVGAKVCDPACGVGKFLLSAIANTDNYNIIDGKVESKIELVGYDKGFDHDEQKTIILAKANMLIYLTEFIKNNPTNTKIISEHVFNKTFKLETNSILGTLANPETNVYDLILTNPPYVTSGTSNLREEINKDDQLKNYFSQLGTGIESLFMEWIIKALKPGGKAFIVIPDSLFIRQNDIKLRKHILNECTIEAVISLPEKSFFSTQKKTSILIIRKKDINTKIRNTLFYLVSEIGETRDSFRLSISQNDLKTATSMYKLFSSGVENLDELISDDRCKYIENEYFQNETWNFEGDFFSKKELVTFDRIKENKKLSLEDYIITVEEITSSVNELILNLKGIDSEKTFSEEFEKIKIKDYYNHAPSNNGLTKKFISNNPGEIPVIGSSKNGNPIGYVNCTSTLKKYSKCISYNRNGSAGIFFYRDGVFAPNEDHNVLINKGSNKIVDEYVALSINLLQNSFNWGNKAGKLKVEEITIEIPFKNGDFDIDEQIRLISIMKNEILIKKEIDSNLNKMITISPVYIFPNANYSKLTLSELPVSICTGKSKYTKKWIDKNLGEYPVYSSDTKNNGVFGYINSYELYSSGFTWSKDGANAGSVFWRENIKFSMTTHCGFISSENINLSKYIFFYFKMHLSSYAVGEQNKRITLRILKSIAIPIPYKGNELDLDAIRYYVEKNTAIDNLCSSINKSTV